MFHVYKMAVFYIGEVFQLQLEAGRKECAWVTRAMPAAVYHFDPTNPQSRSVVTIACYFPRHDLAAFCYHRPSDNQHLSGVPFEGIHI